jgi:hypothetical protein
MLGIRRYCSIIVLIALLTEVAFAQALPGSLRNEEFWKLSVDFSEPDGTFRSDNLLSNETGYQDLIPTLLETVGRGRVYIGVGPEQNFNYIAALKPDLAFIIDIRRGNLNLHLMYKALFEMSRNRADFVSRLFSRRRPAGLTTRSTASEIFAAYASVKPDEALYRRTLREVREHLSNKRRLPLSADDIAGIEYVLHAFYEFGPAIDYNSSSNGRAYFGKPATYEELLTAVDESGQGRSFLSNEENFLLIKNFQAKNLIVPVIGNFAGPKAIQAVGAFLKEKGGVVSAFYVSNVEQYLQEGDSWRNFCRNALALPVDEMSTFIRAIPDPKGQVGLTLRLGSILNDLMLATISCR